MNCTNFSFTLGNIDYPAWVDTGINNGSATVAPNQIPIRSTVEFTVGLNAPPNSSRNIEVTLPAYMRLVALGNPVGVSEAVGGGNNIITINYPGGASTSLTKTFRVSVNCMGNNCTGIAIPLSARVVEDDASCPNKVITGYEVWNDSLLRANFQLLYPNSFVTAGIASIPKGSTVRYKVTYTQDNPCLANGDATIDLHLPAGAIFKGAFQQEKLSNGRHLYPSLPHTVSSPNSISVSPLISGRGRVVFFDIEYPCAFTAANALLRAEIKYSTNPPQCVLTDTVTLEHEADIVPTPTSMPLDEMAFLNKRKRGSSPLFPGGLISYDIVFRNTSQHVITDILITDILPPELTAESFFFLSYPYSQVPIVEVMRGNVWAVASAAHPVSGAEAYRFTLQAGEVLLPQDGIHIVITARIDANVAPETKIDNKANATFRPIIIDCSNNGGNGDGSGDGNGNGGNDDVDLSNNHEITVTTPQPKLKSTKIICDEDCYTPGDTIRFYLHIMNEGDAPITQDLVITDNLPANLEYLGNETIHYYTSDKNDYKPNGKICEIEKQEKYEVTSLGLVTYNNPPNTTSPSWTILASTANPTLLNISGTDFPRIIIGFDCLVNNVAMPNNKGQNGKDNLEFNQPVNFVLTADYTMCTIDELQAEKFVSADGGATFSNQVEIVAGDTVRYQLKLTNIGNTALTNIKLVDDMPHVGDLYLNNGGTTSCNPRNSEFEIAATNFSALSTGTIEHLKDHRPELNGIMDYTTINNGSNIPVPCLGTISPTLQAAPTGNGFVIDLDGLILQPGDSWTFEFDGIVPITAKEGETACNTFLFRASREGSSVVLEVGETNETCVKIKVDDDDDTGTGSGNDCNCDICENLSVEELHTEITNEHRDCESYQLVTTYMGISSPTVFTTIRASVISYDLSANYTDCIKCIKKPFMWASLYGQELQGVPPSVPVGGSLASPYIVPNHPYTNIREVIWENPNGFNLTQIDKLPIEIYLPPVTELPCCEIYAKICIRLTFITENCQLCEEIICIEVNSSGKNKIKRQQKAIAKSKDEDCGCKDKKHAHKSTITSTDDCGCKGEKQKKAKKKGNKRKNLKA